MKPTTKHKGVVFEVDSFGGELAGAFETTDLIARLSAEKPTLAILTDHTLSAAYLLASAARQIIIPEYGRAGSIGALAAKNRLNNAGSHRHLHELSRSHGGRTDQSGGAGL